MSEIIKVEKINEVFMKVIVDSGIRQELYEYFSFYASGYQFSPKFKNKLWDGKIRLFNPMKPILYIGLLDYLSKFCTDREYELEIDSKLTETENISDDYVETLAKELGTSYKPRDYQIQYVLNALRNKRSISLSPTSSGKSFILYLIQQHYWRCYDHRTLIIVPTIGLVSQMASDFGDYGCDKTQIYKITAGVDKKTKHPICISTWQSLIKQPKEWFDQFSVVIGDECHLFAAKSLTTIMEKLTDAPYRHGFTGTISSDSKINKLVLEGVFGTIKRYVTTKQLMDEGTVADFKIKGIILNHSTETKEEFRKKLKDAKSKNPVKNIIYTTEREFLFANEKRNKFIKNLVFSLKDQNNLILFDLIEKHGKILEPLLKQEGRILHFIYGDTSANDRERIRKEVENDNLVKIKLSFGNIIIEVNESEEIPLTDGSMIKANVLTKNHDVSDNWIKFKTDTSRK